MQRLCMEHLRHSNWIETETCLSSGLGFGFVRSDRMFDVAVFASLRSDHQWRQWLRDYGYKYNQTVR